MSDERSITAVDATHGSVIYRYEGEWLRKIAACGNTAMALTDKNLLFYSQETGRWLVQGVVQGDRLRGVAAFGDAGCIVTDRRTFCVGSKSESARVYELNDMHIRNLRALPGKIIMRAPEKTLIYFPDRDQYEYTPQR